MIIRKENERTGEEKHKYETERTEQVEKIE